MDPTPSAAAPFTLLRGSKKLNLIYLKNPKSGCTSASEWLEIASGGRKKENLGDYHRLDLASYESQLVNLDWIENATIFTVVRHPFDRLVSGYADKIGRKTDEHTRQAFCSRYGLPYEKDIAFPDFLEAISSDPYPHEMDAHWRPQSANIAFPYIVPNFVCRLECMSEDFASFAQAIGRPNLGAPGHHNKQSSTEPERVSRIKGYLEDPTLFGMAYDLYRPDFENFSYRSDMIGHLGSDFVPAFSAHRHPRIGRLAEIVSVNAERSTERLRSEFRRVLRDEVFAGNTRSIEEAELQRASGQRGIEGQIAALGLKTHAGSMESLDAKVHSAEASLLSSLCKSYRGSLRLQTEQIGVAHQRIEALQIELQKTNQHAASLAHANSELGNDLTSLKRQFDMLASDLNVKRSQMSVWLDRVDFNLHNFLSKVTLFGSGFQNLFSLAASRRFRREYNGSRE